MIYYDFVITNKQKIDKPDTIKYKFIVEKVALVDDDLTLDAELKKHGIDDRGIGAIIEQLEGLPYGAKHAYAVGNNGRILIEQV